MSCLENYFLGSNSEYNFVLTSDTENHITGNGGKSRTPVKVDLAGVLFVFKNNEVTYYSI